MDNVKVGCVICDILGNNADVSSIVGNKVYPLVANQDTEYPFVVYRRENVIPTDTKDRYVFSFESNIEILAVSEDYDESLELADKISNALNGKEGIIAGFDVKEIKYLGDDEDYIEGAFVQRITFKITIR